MFFNIFKTNKHQKPKQIHPYEKAVEELNQSKYCLVNEKEYDFIKALFKSFESQGFTGRIELKRMSTRALDFRYEGYPIGKVTLNGEYTSFMYLSNLYDVKHIENASPADYDELIKYWTKYVRSVLKLRN